MRTAVSHTTTVQMTPLNPAGLWPVPTRQLGHSCQACNIINILEIIYGWYIRNKFLQYNTTVEWTTWNILNESLRKDQMSPLTSRELFSRESLFINKTDERLLYTPVRLLIGFLVLSAFTKNCHLIHSITRLPRHELLASCGTGN